MKWAIAFILMLGITRANAEVVTRAVGQVGERVVTSRQVVLGGLIDQWLMALEDRPKEALLREQKRKWILAVDTEDFRTQLTRVMLDAAVAMEADALSVSQVDPKLVQLRMTRFQIDMAGLMEWKRWAFSEAEIEQAFQRKLRAKEFLKFKVETSGILVSDEEAREYYDKHRSKFGNYGFSQFRNSIREALTQQKLESRLKDWFEILKKKYRVRYLAAPPTTAQAEVPHL